jgi:hypothetical protein
MLRRTLALALPLALLSIDASAQAGDTWSTPFTGVRHLYRTKSTPNRIHALVINLCAPGVSMRATASTERKRTVSSFATLVKAEAAINGDFFSYDTYGTSGLAIGNGVRWTDTKDGTSSGFAAFGPGKAVFSFPSEVVTDPESWMDNVVSGHPLIVKAGAAIHTDCTSAFCNKNPRTALGFSRNRRTLYLFVVDGRTSISVGMSINQLADEMHGLGAWDAINLDGGGSTTMWLSGKGVLNDPSDGAQRVVGNHLGVQATGSGLPGNCAEDPLEELAANAHLMDGATTTDIDGDGKADVCARAAAGLRCYPSSGTGFGNAVAGDFLADDGGWDDASNWSTLRMGDINGDGLADVCARSNASLVCWPSQKTSFGAAINGPAMADADGYNDVKYYSTLRLADVTGDGKDDACIRTKDGVQCYPSTGTGFGAAIKGPTLDDGSGWGAVDHYGTIRTGDVNADGKMDICARGASGMKCWISDGAGFPTTIDGPAWTDASGWDEPKYWSTLQLADVDGDGRADLCGRSSKGFTCAASTGTGFGAAFDGPAMADSSGWADATNYLSLRMADIDGDKKADLCARANAGIRCYKSTGTGFAAAINGPDLSDADGWWQDKYLRTIRMADINGDGKADLCARSSARVQCWVSDGNGFATAVDGPALSDASGWGAIEYYATLRIASKTTHAPEIPDGGAGGTAGGAGGSNPGGSGGALPDGGKPGTDSSIEGGDAGSGAYASWTPDGSSDGGCGCSAPGRSRVSLSWLALIGLLALRRSRR